MLHIRLDNVLMPEAPKLTLKGRARCWPSRRRETRSTRCSTGRKRPAGQGRLADRQPRQERPAAPDGLSDHDDQLAQLVRRDQGRAARGARRRRGRRGRDSRRQERLSHRLVLRAPTAASGRRRAGGAAKVDRRPARPLRHLERGRAIGNRRCRARTPKMRSTPATWSPSSPATWPIGARATSGPARSSRRSPAPALAAGLAVRPIWYYLLASA